MGIRAAGTADRNRTAPANKPGTLKLGGIAVATGNHAGKTVVIGSDHRGFRLKEWLKRALKKRGWKVVDKGTYSPARVDYPIVMIKVAKEVGKTAGRRAVGIGICGSGVGACIPAAKVAGVHPALCRTASSARETRTHNNSNFLSLAADFTPPRRALAITETWLASPFFTRPERDLPYLRRYIQTARLDRGRK